MKMELFNIKFYGESLEENIKRELIKHHAVLIAHFSSLLNSYDVSFFMLRDRYKIVVQNQIIAEYLEVK